MNARQMVFSIPEGGHATLALPEPLTAEAIGMLEDASALMFRCLRRSALEPRPQDAGAIEYASWRSGCAPAQDAGAIEYDSWSANVR